MTNITIINGGVRLAGSVYGELDRPAILLLHGISLSRDGWLEVAQALAERFLVFSLDFRGHGQSDRADRYDLLDYVSDATATLAYIGKPTSVIGHSLGGCVAGVLAQTDKVKSAFLVDPPWFMGEPAEWQKSAFPKLFSAVSAQQKKWQQQGAPLATYLQFASNAPSPMGGIASDHFDFRLLLSYAAALQQQDTRCWENALDNGRALSAIDTARPFKCPTTILQSDPACGAALLEGHEKRLAEVAPNAKILRYDRCGHRPQHTNGFKDRFLQDLKEHLANGN